MNELIRSGEGQSKFDNTIGDLITLRRLIDQANFYSQTDQLYLWQRTLLAIERELSPLMNSDERQQSQDVRVSSVPARLPKRFNINGVTSKLDEYQKFLLDIRFKKGLSIQAGEDARTAVLR